MNGNSQNDSDKKYSQHFESIHGSRIDKKGFHILNLFLFPNNSQSIN